ncbi:MAG: hypothetical protein MZV64_42730 [Ignavibacteriales bacterium]|nr:hypothetical protein [Ignavibacteriales bacterium]
MNVRCPTPRRFASAAAVCEPRRSWPGAHRPVPPQPGVWPGRAPSPAAAGRRSSPRTRNARRHAPRGTLQGREPLSAGAARGTARPIARTFATALERKR